MLLLLLLLLLLLVTFCWFGIRVLSVSLTCNFLIEYINHDWECNFLPPMSLLVPLMSAKHIRKGFFLRLISIWSNCLLLTISDGCLPRPYSFRWVISVPYYIILAVVMDNIFIITRNYYQCLDLPNKRNGISSWQICTAKQINNPDNICRFHAPMNK